MGAEDPRPKLAYVVKYFPPMPRISGILRFVSDLADELGAFFRLRVITYRYNALAKPREKRNGYDVIRRGRPFPFLAGREIRSWRPETVIFGSGFWRPELLWGYWELFRMGLGANRPELILTQYTNMTPRLRFFLKKLFPPPDKIIATTTEIGKYWEPFYPGRVTVIPPGLRTAMSKEPAARQPGKVRIGYFGHLEPHKGPDLALKIFQELNPPAAELVIAGEGEMAEELSQKARGWTNIRVIGYLAEVDREIRSCDLVLLPFRSAVSVLGYSRVALEALAAGIPVLTTPNPSVAPLISEGENGFICSGEEELKQKLRLFLSDDDLRRHLARGAQNRGKAFDIKQTALDHLHLIRPDKGTPA